MKEVKLPCYGIRINLTEDGGGSITSDLHPPAEGEDEKLYNAAIDGIESIVLGHAIAGVDVESPAYLQGIESAVEAAAHNF